MKKGLEHLFVLLNVIKKIKIAPTYTIIKLIASHIALKPPGEFLKIPIKNGNGKKEKSIKVENSLYKNN